MYRGSKENAAKFIEAQDKVIEELYPLPPRWQTWRRKNRVNRGSEYRKYKTRYAKGRENKCLILSKAAFSPETQVLRRRLRESEKDVQVLAVWGSPSSGKTTVSVKLAKHLADKKRNVVLLLCDMTAPMLPCICPPSDLEWERSLGSILAATHVTIP